LEQLAMNKSDFKIYKERLLEIRSLLRGDITQMADATLNKNGGNAGNMPIHMADIGSDANEQEFTLSLMASEEDTLGAIEKALEKIEDGGYSRCEECGGGIPKSRLNAIPYASHCIKCANALQDG